MGYKLKHHAMGLAVVLLSFSLTACDSGSSTSSDTSTSNTSNATTPLEKVAIEYGSSEFVGGVAMGELWMGSPDAPLTIIEYGSLTCGVCANFDKTTFVKIKEAYIDTGRVKFIFRNQLHGQSDLVAAMISRCAGPQKAWAIMGMFFEKQRQWVTQDFMDPLASLARKAGMNRAEFDVCVNNSDLQKSLVELTQMSTEDGVTGTPTLFIGDEKIVGSAPYQEYVNAIEKNL